jgi:hypothetical protein
MTPRAFGLEPFAAGPSPVPLEAPELGTMPAIFSQPVRNLA